MAEVQDISREEVKAWLRQGVSAKILVAGKVGVGKSTMVNGLVGSKVANKETSPVAVTQAVRKYERVVENISLEVFDTPGLDDPAKEDDEETIQAMVQETGGQVDLLLFCFDIRGRMTRNEINSMKMLTTAFGTQIWNNAVFVLTFANKVEAPSKSELRWIFEGQIKSFTTAIRDALHKKCNIEERIAKGVPILPAGYCEPSLPDREDWLTELWLATFKRIRQPANAAFLQMGAPRFWTETDINYNPPYKRKLAIIVKRGVKDLADIVIELWKEGVIQDIIVGAIKMGAKILKK